MVFLKKIFIIAIISVGILGPLLVLADSYGLQTAGDQAGLSDLSISKKTIPQFAGEVIGVGLSLVGIIFFLLMLYAGLRWMIAMGKSEDVQKAKDTLEAAAIGLVIILAAYAITQFVFTNLGVGGGGTSGVGGSSGGAGPGTAGLWCMHDCEPPEDFSFVCKEITDQNLIVEGCSVSDGTCVEVSGCPQNVVESQQLDNEVVWCLIGMNCRNDITRAACRQENGREFADRSSCLLEIPECLANTDCVAPYGSCYMCENSLCVRDPDISCN